MNPRGRRKDARPRAKVEDVHRYMWSLADDRHRLQISIADLAAEFGLHRDIVNDALLAMRATGRIKFVACRAQRAYVYEITDPATYSPRGIHLRRPKQPVWG